ncbi:MAG: glycoside hydrolase family 18 protein [Flavobacteriales bacterium]|jgi:chitinase|tara:strand:- start:897 stop:1964 length:1068 start_codon:yes stop_codon:yes gene_type:complete
MKKLILLLLFILSCSNNTEIKPQVIAYYAGDEKSIDEFNLDGVDQIIYSFLHLKGNKLAIDNKTDSLTLINVVNQKNKYPKLKVLVSLGGWGGCETCSDVFSSKEARTEFAISTADIIESFNADGIDLDWEYPGISGFPGHSYKPEDRENFTDLVIQLRRYMKKEDILSFAAGASNRFFKNSIEWDKVMPLVNNVNLMTYDFYGSGSTKTGHHTALSSSEFQDRSAKSSIEALINLGVNPKQIFIGGAFYIKTFKNVENINNGLNQNTEWNKSYNQINFEDVRSNFSFYWDSLANSPYAYDSINKIFATFDDHKSIKLKSKYALEKKLGGIMFWQLMNDKKQNGLLKTLVNTIKP